jgi:hypothetical protein
MGKPGDHQCFGPSYLKSNKKKKQKQLGYTKKNAKKK